MSSDEHVSKDTFELFKEYTQEHFDRLHACDQRIEQKVDEILSRQQAKQEKKEERIFDTKQKVFIGFMMAVATTVSSFLTKVLSGN